mmetsp:Transcript_78620/g.254686  ORF Transcript_78620/g.254686 Transcript_78620/m.254686 type:complete len:417 (-) Transcript_78620:117-1367(-)
MAATGEYFGTVKSYNDRKGWGFIECPETQQLYGKDILFQKCELPSPVQKGDQLSFSVTPGRNGVLAVGLHMLGKADPPAEERGRGAEGSFVGSIKSFNPQNGWGFIECAETQQIYGKDILVLKEELHGVTVMQGQQVTFSVTQGRKGPLATALQFALKGGSVAGGNGGLDAVLGRPTVGVVQSHQQSGGHAGGSFVGALKSFNPQKGWGFIECRETHAIYAKDILVLKAELAATPATPGLCLSFSVTQGRTGPIAVNVRMLGSVGVSQVRPAVAAMQRLPAMQALQANPMAQGLLAGCNGGGHVPLLSAARGPEAQEHICGSIKSFDEQKGWGFVTGGPILQLYGKDIFAHKREFMGSRSPDNGDRVRFVVEAGRDGRPEARSVVLQEGDAGVNAGGAYGFAAPAAGGAGARSAPY